jgi:hypothetical protein
MVCFRGSAAAAGVTLAYRGWLRVAGWPALTEVTTPVCASAGSLAGPLAFSSGPGCEVAGIAPAKGR